MESEIKQYECIWKVAKENEVKKALELAGIRSREIEEKA